MKKVGILSVLCVIAAVISLAACSYEKPPASPYALYANTADNFDSDVVKKVFGKWLQGSAGAMSPENSEKLRAAIRDIRINNSRIALPLMICDLPEGFSAEYGEEFSLDNNDYTFFDGDIFYGEERLADAYILRGRGAEESQGVIVGILLTSADCKWSVGEADICDIQKLLDIFGEPSSAEAVVSEKVPDSSYIADNGDFALFLNSVSSVMAFSLDCERLEENKSLCEYVPYDDFDEFSDIAPLSGEPMEFDGNAALAENGVVIGDFSCSADCMVSEIGGDVKLVFNGTMPYDESDESLSEYVSDTYILLYKGRYFGIAQSYRRESQPPDEAHMYMWTFFSRKELPCDASLAGIPISENIDNIRSLFKNCGERDGGGIGMYDICGLDETQYFSVYMRDSEDRSVLLLKPYL